MRALSKTEGSLKWLFLACLLAVAVGIGFMAFNQWATTQDKYDAQTKADTASANAETLAKEIGSMCSSEGKLMVNNRDLCAKGEEVLENPSAVISGPKGDPGYNGLDGTNGVDGPPGKDGTNGVDGPPGKDGIDGTNGVDGSAGQDGLNGADGANGTDGTNGTNGTNGADGADGPPPASFTWTDSTSGTKYTCVPDPVGSTTYSCTAGPASTTPKPIK